jgi:TatD DNase family protein
MIPQFVQLGGYFSFSGYFAHPRKSKQRETFRHVPKDRLLIETDAPDMIPPERMVEFRVAGDDPAPNHPGNVRAVYRFLSEFLELPLDQLASAVEANFRRLFRAIL